jgi:hypothetical protein
VRLIPVTHDPNFRIASWNKTHVRAFSPRERHWHVWAREI